MKIIVSLSSFIFCLNAKACPNLTGAFLCTRTTDHPDAVYTFEQTNEADAWTFSLTAKVLGQNSPFFNYSFVADGIQHEITESVSNKKLLVTANCAAEKLFVDGVANFEQAQPIHFSEIFNLTDNGDLRDESKNIQGQTIVEICRRMDEFAGRSMRFR